MRLHLLVVFSLLGAWAGDLRANGVPRDEVVRAVQMLEGMHFLPERGFGDRRGNLTLEIFMGKLDPGKYYFSAEDHGKMADRYRDQLDNMIRKGDLGAGVEVFGLFQKRVEGRKALAQSALDDIGDDDLPEVIRTRGAKSEWAKEEEMSGIWRERIEGELARELTREYDRGKAVENILRRHARFLSDISQEEGAVGEMLLGAVCESYDPHTEYLGAEGMDEFSISMELQLCGIGVVLSQDGGEVKVESVVPGGPASKDGRMQKGDRIVGIGEGERGGEMEDISGLRIDKIVRKIRGEKGTMVTLDLLREGEGAKSVTLSRDEVQLNNQAVRGAIVSSGDVKVGIITVPSFYHDGKGRSVSDDMRSVIRSMEDSEVTVLVVDLRQDGGGSLEESIKAAGIFVPGRTVVQIRDGHGGVIVRRAPASGGGWEEPTVVLVDRNSASASEIFAGAVKDHGAGILVGDSRTFGKGTVQALMGLSPGGLMHFIAAGRGEEGHLKLTIQKFYRANGESTQGKGVESDIRLPSITDIGDNGEERYPTHIPHSAIPGTALGRGVASASVIEALRGRSRIRTSDSEVMAAIEERRREIEMGRIEGTVVNFGKREKEKEPENTFLSTKATVITSLRGGEVEISTGEVGCIYDGKPVPTLGGEKSDPILEEAVMIASDWEKLKGGAGIARGGVVEKGGDN